MAKLIRVGRRVFDLDAVIAAEQRTGSLEVHLTGVRTPLQFSGDEASVVWTCIVARAQKPAPAPSLEPAPRPPEFTVMEVLSDEEDPGAHADAALFRNIDLPADPLVDAILDRAT